MSNYIETLIILSLYSLSDMSKVRKTWTIIAAVLAGGVAIAAFSLAGPMAEAGVKLN